MQKKHLKLTKAYNTKGKSNVVSNLRIMFTVRTVDVMSTEYRPSIGRYFVDAPRPNIGHMSAVYQSTVGDMTGFKSLIQTTVN